MHTHTHTHTHTPSIKYAEQTLMETHHPASVSLLKTNIDFKGRQICQLFTLLECTHFKLWKVFTVIDELLVSIRSYLQDENQTS